MTQHPHAAQFDTAPLSWVMGEIREALERSAAALHDAAASGFDARDMDAHDRALKHAKTYLHQAHGALQMVDVEGVGRMTQGAEDAIERFKDGSIECTAERVQLIAEAYLAVTEYLEELLSGAPQQPARLFPYYRALQELLGAERIHPADLLFADLSAPGPMRRVGTPAAAPDYAACRARFEKALLPFLKSADAAAQRSNAQALQEAIAQVAEGQSDNSAHTFWLAMQSFAELVAGGQLASNLYVKQLFGMINLQIRRLSQGQAELPEGMLRDALFFIAAAPEPSDTARALRRAFRLDGVVPADYDKKRYGRINAEALKEAKEALAHAQQAWDRLSNEIDPALETQFQQQLEALGTACAKLGAPALAQLQAELARAARDSVMSGRSPQFSLEMAAAMLFALQGLDRIRQLPDDFDAHAEVIGTRLLALAAGETPPHAPQWQDELSRQIQQEQTVAVLAAEMKNGLRQVEKVLDDFYADGSKRPSLSQIGPLLHQLEGAVAILDQDDAMRAALHVKEAVRTLAAANGDPALEAASLQNIAQNIGALGFFVDMLAQNFDAARQRFSFDSSEGMLRAVPFGEAPAAEAPAEHDEVGEASVELAPVAPLPADDGVEAELLEIFIGEAQEVLGVVDATLPAARNEPSSQERLTVLRRSFHTLKGSGRMVGLDNFAEGAAAVEKTLNVWLSESRDATPDLLALLEHASAEMGAWVAELVATGRSARDSAALVDCAVRVMEGGAFQMIEAAPEEPVEEIVFTEVAPEPVLEAPVITNVIDFPSIVRPTPVDDNTKRIGSLEIALPLYNIYMAETDELVRTLTRDFGEWRHEPERPVSADALKAAHTLAGTSATVGFKALREVAYALEMALKSPSPRLDDSQRELLDDTVERVRQMLQGFALGELAEAQPDLVARLEALRVELEAQDAASYGGAVTNLDAELEEKLHALFEATLASIIASKPEVEERAPAPVATPAAPADDIDALFDDDPFDAPVLTQAAPPPAIDADDPDDEDDGPELEPELIGEPEPEPPAEPQALATEEAGVAEAQVDVKVEVTIGDELDADLLPVFIEEASDLLPEIGNGLRTWQANPADTAPAQMLQRALHTVKGSARMAGAMRLGQHAHDIETQIENMVHAGTTTPAAFDELLANYDHALALFELLQNPGGTAVQTAPTLAPVTDEAPGQQRAALVRVRADILDRLVNQAGEVSITRSKLESQVATLKTSLADFSENLGRLRRQLREVEMQAESQIASRMSISSEREFDPLEFDRFTRLQELTRMMAESVNDVGSFHESLGRTVDSAGTDLVTQSRLTRDLQRDLMRVRMVPFASLSERLFRVARQTAKEVDKRVNLDIRGGSVEIDRSVLEQMAAPFEHLLRNAIVHGVETRTVRGASGKAETGELLIHASQQGNEVVIQFTDDGAGLNLERIRAKAVANGLIKEGSEVNDLEAADLIFEPGFSTAEVLSELAGRGVGMDVVRSQAQALGGRVDIQTTAGKGACFTIHLPLTLAVTQVVLTVSSGTTYALPSILVEQVLQVKEVELNAFQASGRIQFQGQSVALHYLPHLLGDPDARPMVQRSSPVLMLRNGNDRLAVQVDDVQGNREVVIKNVGPQLSRMIGIAGATVLGSGDIVLILNPVALSHHLDNHPELRPQAESTQASTVAAVPARDYVVMVVDDSLTVRKVTQRLLEREGYQVMLAKDGVDALERLQEAVPDLMLVDIEMPRMDGFDLTRNIRGNESTRAVPIIMITSRTADKHRNYALDLGVNAYFGKPFQEDVLLAAISGLLKREMPVGA